MIKILNLYLLDSLIYREVRVRLVWLCPACILLFYCTHNLFIFACANRKMATLCWINFNIENIICNYEETARKYVRNLICLFSIIVYWKNTRFLKQIITSIVISYLLNVNISFFHYFLFNYNLAKIKFLFLFFLYLKIFINP